MNIICMTGYFGVHFGERASSTALEAYYGHDDAGIVQFAT